MSTALPPLETVEGVAILFVMATEMEYGEALKRRFRPFITGVGPIEAALGMGSALARLSGSGRLPELVVCLGSAGSRTLDHGEVYQASSVSYRDMDASPLGFAKGVTPFLDQPAVIAVDHRIPDIPSASLSTGAAIISGEAYGRIDSEMVDMESYAVLRAATEAGVPFIGLRGISDGRSELGRYEDWADYLHIVDANLAAAVDRMAEALRGGLLRI